MSFFHLATIRLLHNHWPFRYPCKPDVYELLSAPYVRGYKFSSEWIGHLKETEH